MKQITAYEAIDGTIFPCATQANRHEVIIDCEEKLSKLLDGPNGVSYIDTKEQTANFIRQNINVLAELLITWRGAI